MTTSVRAEDAAYIAGLLDGEGHISVTFDHKRHHYLEVKITNTNVAVLQFVESVFGGRIWVHSKATPNRLTAYRWGIGGKGLDEFLETIQPFVRIRARQVEAALAFRATVRPFHATGQTAKLNTCEMEVRERLRQEINTRH